MAESQSDSESESAHARVPWKPVLVDPACSRTNTDSGLVRYQVRPAGETRQSSRWLYMGLGASLTGQAVHWWGVLI